MGNKQYIVHFIFAIVIATLLIFSDYYYSYLQSIRNLVLKISVPIEKVSYYTQNYFTDIIDITHIVKAETIKEELEKKIATLEYENSLLKIELAEMERMTKQYNRLNNILGITGQSRINKLIVARIIGIRNYIKKKTIIIDKGSDNGIDVGDTVIDSNGLVGQIANTTSNSSLLMLVTDINHKTPVRVEPNGYIALLSGSNTDELTLDYIPQDAFINKGDLIITSGLGGVFPPGIKVATVDKVTKKGIYLDVTAKPISKLEKNIEIFVTENVESNTDYKINLEPYTIEADNLAGKEKFNNN